MLRRAAALVVPFYLAGCMVGPDFVPPQTDGDPEFIANGLPNLVVPESQETAQRVAIGKKVSSDWWQLLRAPELDAMLQQAIAGNRSLVVAQANLAQAQEVVNQASGALLPQLDANAGLSRQRLNFATSGLTIFPPKTFNLFQLGPTLSYALDVWGGTRRRIEQQQALAQFADYQLGAAYLTLTGNAVGQAVQIASARAQIKAVDTIIADDQRNVDLVREEFNSGVASQSDLEFAASQLASDRSLLPPLRQQLSVARHALAILTGKAPAAWSPPEFDLADFTLPLELPVSLPSALVHQRPDVLAAEAQLHAASAAIGVATAQLYPNITISASIAQTALVPGKLFAESANGWDLGGSLTAPIFHGGELEAQRRAAIAAYRGTLANYEQTVLDSFGQVADLLEALAHDAELLHDQHQALDSAASSLNLTRTAFAAGTANTLQVIESSRLYQQALLGYARAQAQRYLDTAQFFVAMGGGWWDARAQTQAEGEGAVKVDAAVKN